MPSSAMVSQLGKLCRKKRKWDQPAEQFIAGGLAVPGILPSGNLGSLPGVVVPSLGPVPSVHVPSSLAPNCATMYPVIPAPLMPQQCSVVNPKGNQVVSS